MIPSPHTPVLLQEWLDALKENEIKVYLDATLGAAGHAEAVLKAHPEIERFIGIDQDSHALSDAQKRLAPWQEKLEISHANFTEMDSLIPTAVNAILIDLGVSSMQLDQAERGFSFSQDGPLDMRMDPTASLTAEEIVNQWDEKELARIIWEYGEERKSRQAAKAIVQARRTHPIQTTWELVQVLKRVFPGGKPKGVHPMTLIFQALRICVNRELEVIQEAIPKAISLLAPKGRLGVITFHSLEDRIVKNQFRYAASCWKTLEGPLDLREPKEPTVHLITKKPLVPTREETHRNRRARSAKLRVIEKL